MTNTPDRDPCGCCQADLPLPTLYNRPGLPELAYRIGVQPQFLRRMVARLSLHVLPDDPDLLNRPLADLTTRTDDDPSIALLDAWATVADVLTFYQERIANEGFLRTATERRSLLELARTIGYELRPGVAAHTFLTFVVEDAAGAPGRTMVPSGTKIQSIPAQGQLPQTFETSSTIQARAEWNALKPSLTQPQVLTTSAKLLYFAGTTTNLKLGDLLLIAVRPDDADPASAPQTKIVRVQKLFVETHLQRTRVNLEADAQLPAFVLPKLQQAVLTLQPLALNNVAVNTAIVGQTWSESKLNAFFAIQNWSKLNVQRYLAAPPPSKLPSAETGVFAFRTKLGFFGHNAPRHGSLPKADNLKSDPYSSSWDDNGGRSIWEDSQGVDYDTPDVYLERAVPELVRDSWIVIDGSNSQPAPYRISSVVEESLADYALQAKVTGLELTKVDGTALQNNTADKPPNLKVRKTTAYVGNERLTLADLPIVEDIAADDTSILLDQLVLGLEVGQVVAISGEQADLANVTATEIVQLTGIQHSNGLTTLLFDPPLANSYIRKTVQINANVAHATHGETVREVLGSGDGAKPNQQFTLKKPPLTYVSAATASGTQNTLTVRVDSVRWDEAPRMVDLDARSERYLVRIEDDGKTSVIFGDGKRGARLPTGSENVVATYRSGIGFTGMVAAGSLTLLQTRPLGIRGVTNPLPAAEAAEPENRDSARTNAPLTVLTLDRIVSLHDFEDFTRAFAGIGKAQAIAFWRGERQYVHITIAAASGATVAAEAPLLKNLQSAIAAASDPGVVFEIDTYQPLYFNLKAKLLIDQRYEFDNIRAAVEAALLHAFAFGQRRFGQAVTTAEVVTVIQRVSGVVATDLDQLYLVTDNPAANSGLATRLIAEPARWNKATNTVDRVQLLLINPAGIELEELSA